MREGLGFRVTNECLLLDRGHKALRRSVLGQRRPQGTRSGSRLVSGGPRV